MAESVNAPLGIECGCFGESEDDTRGPQCGGGQAGQHNAVSDGARSLVSSSPDDGCAGLQPGHQGGFPSDLAGDLRRLISAGQEFGVEFERSQHFLRPAPVRHVEEQGAGSIRDVSGEFSGQSKADVILGQQKMSGALEYPGFVIADPEDLGRAESGEGRI